MTVSVSPASVAMTRSLKSKPTPHPWPLLIASRPTLRPSKSTRVHLRRPLGADARRLRTMKSQNNLATQFDVLDTDFDETRDERPYVGARARTIHTMIPDRRRDLVEAAHLLSKGHILG